MLGYNDTGSINCTRLLNLPILVNKEDVGSIKTILKGAFTSGSIAGTSGAGVLAIFHPNNFMVK